MKMHISSFRNLEPDEYANSADQQCGARDNQAEANGEGVVEDKQGNFQLGLCFGVDGSRFVYPDEGHNQIVHFLGWTENVLLD